MADVFTGLLTTLVDGALEDPGEAMLNDIYNISTANFSQSIISSLNPLIFPKLPYY